MVFLPALDASCSARGGRTARLHSREWPSGGGVVSEGWRLFPGGATDMDYSLNAYLGWLLLLAGVVAAVRLDPWSLSERDPRAIVGSTRMAARHAQAVVLAMGFLQLAVSLLLRDGGLGIPALG